MSGIFNTIGNAIGNVQASFSNTVNGFSQPNQVGTTTNGFLQANSLIAKFAFIILIIFAFLYLLNLGVSLISYLLSPPANPYLIYGLNEGSTPMTIKQDPSQTGSVYLARSNNREGGLEFTWTTWLYVNDIANYSVITSAPSSSTTCSTIGNSSAKYQHIFNKGDTGYDVNNLATVNNCPGLYLSTQVDPKKGAQLYLIMDTINNSDTSDTIEIDNIPIRKWFHLAIRVKNTVLDAYVNGVIAQRQLLSDLPRQNYEDVQICQNGGFSGSLSNLRYYQYALNVFEINNIVNYGPNMALVNNTSSTGGYHYLSKSWYSYNQ